MAAKIFFSCTRWNYPLMMYFENETKYLTILGPATGKQNLPRIRQPAQSESCSNLRQNNCKFHLCSAKSPSTVRFTGNNYNLPWVSLIAPYFENLSLPAPPCLCFGIDLSFNYSIILSGWNSSCNGGARLQDGFFLLLWSFRTIRFMWRRKSSSCPKIYANGENYAQLVSGIFIPFFTNFD